MFTDSPMTSHEDRLLDAWDDYADKRLAAEAAMSDPDLHATQRMAFHKLAQDAYQRFMVVFGEPTPADLADESRKLTVEGFLLLALVAGFIGLFLPDLEEHFWPLALTFVAIAALGGWSVHYLGRLGRHIGRRM